MTMAMIACRLPFRRAVTTYAPKLSPTWVQLVT